MKRKLNRAGLMLALVASSALVPLSAASAAATPPLAKTDSVIFAGGCFWGIQAVFQHTRGVISATSGYAGGSVDRPDYDQVSSGRTGHAESVKIVFDPSQISYAQLMRIFFSPFIHDPTLLNRQGPDVGTQYRSAVFASTGEQKKATDAFIDQLNKSHTYARPIVTQVSETTRFWPAEAYHQNYAELHPDQPYIAINDAPKVVNLRRAFPALYTDRLAAHE
jgi:peptide-methionine (S)-S-oxide reductase